MPLLLTWLASCAPKLVCMEVRVQEIYYLPPFARVKHFVL
jgi:hypothetical protein